MGGSRRLTANQGPPSVNHFDDGKPIPMLHKQQWLSEQILSWSTEKQGDVQQTSSEAYAHGTQDTAMDISLYFGFSFVKTPKSCSKNTASPRSCPRTTSKPQPIHHFVNPDCLCFERSLRLSHPAIFIHRLPSKWCGLSGSHCAIIINISIECFIKYVHNRQTNAIFMYRLRWVFVPWRSPYKTNLAGKKSDFMSRNWLSMPTAIFMNRLLMVILRIYWLHLILFAQFAHSVSHTKKRSLVPPSTFLCELIL